MTTNGPTDERAQRGAQSAGSGGAVMRRFQDDLAAAARTDATVLLRGEGGTGKTRWAAALHRASARAAGPFVSVHLGAVSPTLIESELFGHVRGAFTSARGDRAGAFRRADGGTLVLDDVQLLPLALQTKLLRALQERTVEPLGSESSVAIDVRFCATSSIDLARLVREGRFREDLFYRLAVVVLDLPPLRARGDELAQLADEALAACAERLGRPQRALSEEAVQRLAEHPWPGNVRELENALERVCALGPEGAPIEPSEFDFLGESIDGEERRIAKLALAAGVSVTDLELAVLEEALAQHRGNMSAAARQVGLTRRAFEYRLARAEDPNEAGA